MVVEEKGGGEGGGGMEGEGRRKPNRSNVDAEERSDTSALLLVVLGCGWGVAVVVRDLFFVFAVCHTKSKKLQLCISTTDSEVRLRELE